MDGGKTKGQLITFSKQQKISCTDIPQSSREDQNTLQEGQISLPSLKISTDEKAITNDHDEETVAGKKSKEKENEKLKDISEPEILEEHEDEDYGEEEEEEELEEEEEEEEEELEEEEEEELEEEEEEEELEDEEEEEELEEKEEELKEKKEELKEKKEELEEEEELEEKEEELEEKEEELEEEEEQQQQEDEEDEEEDMEAEEEEDEDVEGEEIDVEIVDVDVEEDRQKIFSKKPVKTSCDKLMEKDVKEVKNIDYEKNEKHSTGSKKKKEREVETCERKKENMEQEKGTEKRREKDVIPTPIERREAETSETETEESEVEDFPTEGLLQELHFLNASCERPHLQTDALSQIHKTPKKQRKLEFGISSEDLKIREGTRSGSGIKRKRTRKSITPSPRKLNTGQSPRMKLSKKSCRANEEDMECQENISNMSEDEDDDEGVLTIVANEESPKRGKETPSPKSRKKMRGEGGTETGEVPQEVIELIQSGIDEMLEEKAERTHLTATHVKNIIKNVMTDENVLTMVRNTVLGIPISGPTGSAVYEPTLTRAKTKELIEQQAAGGGHSNIWAGLTNHTAGAVTTFTPETQALVSVDFPEEDEDEEYKPEADDQLHSDEESLVSTSSPCTPSTIQSGATTPASQRNISTPCSPRSGSVSTPSSHHPVVFQAPSSHKSVQRVLSFDKEVVSQRTRSKLPLTETPLECLEMAFRPPDVTTDMYETEVDNEEWKEFLIDFIHPLKSTEVVEDEEADPEYNILEDKEDALDLREEMRGDRAVQISKKEIQELMTELLDTLDGDERSDPIRVHLSQHIVPRELKKSPFKSPEICQPTKDQENGPSPESIVVEIMKAEFTSTQLEVLRCQMMQHVQLLTTSVIMTHGSHQYPELKRVADGCRDNLDEIKKSSEFCGFQNTFFSPINLQPALDIITTLKDIDVPNLKRDMSTNALEIPATIIEVVLNSTAFPYPQMLPTRMFQQPTMRGFTKVIFVPSEDTLMAIGLRDNMNPEYHSKKCNRTSQFAHMAKAVASTTSSILVAKTPHQATNRIKNIKCRARDTPNNPVLQYLETGTFDLPTAKAEPLLPCFPCPVQVMPEAALRNPFKAVVRRQQTKLRMALQNAAKEAAHKATIALNQAKLEAEFKGIGEIQNQIHNIVIIQPSVSTVSTTTCINTAPSLSAISNIHISESSTPTKKYISQTDTFTDKLCVQTNTPKGERCFEAAAFNSQSITTTSNDKLNGDPSSLGEDVLLVHSPICHGELDSIVFSQSKKDALPKNLSVAQNQGNDKDSRSNHIVCPQSQTNENEILGLTASEGTFSGKGSDSLNSLGEKHAETIMQVEEEEKVTVNNERQTLDNSMDVDNETSVINCEYSSNLKENTVNNEATCGSLQICGKKESVGCENMPLLQCSPDHSPLNEKNLPITPDKLSPTTASFPSQQLYLCTPFSTPEKSEEQSGSPVSLSTSLCTPVFAAPSMNTSPEKALQGLRQRNLSAELESSEQSHVAGTRAQTVQQDTTRGNSSMPLTRVTQSPVAALVTSVYEGSVSSKGKEKRALHLVNFTPNKPETRLRKISPAKTFKSPLKASPLKQVSPILRKYHKYSPKKRNIRSGKLLPILPKMAARKRSEPRKLAPKSQKSLPTDVMENVSAQGKTAQHSSRCESVLHRAKHQQGDNGDLLPLEDQLRGEGVSTPPRRQTRQHRMEEEFEEDTLEEEEDEDEDEEEEDEDDDLAAEQQREEHLAALLKASSTITLRRSGGGGDGGVGDHGVGRKLTKQQRRLQARISALSSIPDPAAQDKFMAQSYLMRVREALVAQDPACFKKFLFILNDFTENPNQSPIQLYNQLCEVLSDFPHLLEEFVAFLLPQQAIALGKYAQYCAIHRMRDFLEKLELQFGKQPQYIQKIIRLLHSFQGRPNLDLAEVKAALTPLLRYPHLVESFSQCFPTQPPPPSLQSDFEDLKLELSESVDSMEELVLPDDDTTSSPSQCACPCHSNAPTTHTRTDHCHSCALRFSEGRVYLQCGKTLRPARVTYTESSTGVKVTPFGESNSEVQNEASKEASAT